jgi:rhodanese-related sulfurtransferase
MNPNRLKLINPQTLKQLIDQDSVLLVDVREYAEHAGEKIEGAVLFPLSKFEPCQIPNDLDKQLVLFCRSSNRSSQAAQQLLSAGYIEVAHLEGGLLAWKEQGLPTTINKNAPISLMRQVQIVAGSLVFFGTLSSVFINPLFWFLPAFVGAGLTFAGITDTCAMAMLLAKLPYNQKGS